MVGERGISARGRSLCIAMPHWSFKVIAGEVRTSSIDDIAASTPNRLLFLANPAGVRSNYSESLFLSGDQIIYQGSGEVLFCWTR